MIQITMSDSNCARIAVQPSAAKCLRCVWWATRVRSGKRSSIQDAPQFALCRCSAIFVGGSGCGMAE